MSLQTPTHSLSPNPVPERTHPPRVIHSPRKLPSTWNQIHTNTRSDLITQRHHSVAQCLPRGRVERGLESKLEGLLWCPKRGDSCENLSGPHQNQMSKMCLLGSWEKRGAE